MNTTNQVEMLKSKFTETERQDIELNLSDLDLVGWRERHANRSLADWRQSSQSALIQKNAPRCGAFYFESGAAYLTDAVAV